MKLSIFRSIFLVVLSAGVLTGCLPATVETMGIPKVESIQALSSTLQSVPTGNISAQFRVLPYSTDQVLVKINCTNNNSYPVTVSFPNGVSLDIYNAYAYLVEKVKNQSGDSNDDFKLTIAPGDSVEVQSFYVTKPVGEDRLAFTQLEFTCDGEAQSKIFAVAAIF